MLRLVRGQVSHTQTWLLITGKSGGIERLGVRRVAVDLQGLRPVPDGSEVIIGLVLLSSRWSSEGRYERDGSKNDEPEDSAPIAAGHASSLM